jgi:hypothetical protein
VTYKSENLKYSNISSNKLAILPVLAGDGWEGFRRQTGDELTVSLRSKFQHDYVIDPIQTLSIINAQNLTDSYSKLVESYDKTAIINKQTLFELGKCLGSRFLLYSKVGQTTNFEPIVGVNGKLDYAKINEVQIAIQLWDVEVGDIVWEGYCGGAGLSDIAGSDLSSLITLAAKGLSERIGKSKSETPPCKSSKDLLNEASKSNSIPYIIIGGITIVALIAIMFQ